MKREAEYLYTLQCKLSSPGMVLSCPVRKPLAGYKGLDPVETSAYVRTYIFKIFLLILLFSICANNSDVASQHDAPTVALKFSEGGDLYIQYLVH